MQRFEHNEWRGASYALYLRGRREKFGTPYLTSKNATTPKRGYIALLSDLEAKLSCLPFAFKSNYSKLDFSRLFGKVRSNKLMHL